MAWLEFAAEDPDFDADDAHDGIGFGGSVVNVGSKSLQWNSSFFGPFGSGDFSAAQTAGYHDFDADGTSSHAALNRLLHGATEGDALFELLTDGVCHQLRFEINAVDFENVDANIQTGSVEHRFDLAGQVFDSLSAFANYYARTSGVDLDLNLIGFSGDLDFRDASARELFGKELAQTMVLFDKRCNVFFIDEPVRSPALVDAESKTVRIYFLTQDLVLSCCDRSAAVSPLSVDSVADLFFLKEPYLVTEPDSTI